MGKPARPSSNILALLVLGAIAALRYLWFATRSKTAPVAAVRPANADPQPAEPQPRVCVACAASEPDPPALRRSKSMAENSVLLCITVLFGVFGVLQFREADDPVVNPPSREFSIAVGAPSAAPGGPGGAPGAFGSLNDGNGPIQVKDVVYSEEPAGRGNSVGVGVVLQFDRPIVGALPVALRMVFAVEDGFDNPSCSKSAAGFYGAPPSDSPKSTCKAQTHDGLARVDLQTTIADDHNPGPDSSQRKSIELSAQIDQGVCCTIR